MSYVMGIDFSTRHIDLVLLCESNNGALWFRYTPTGETALERLRNLPQILPKHSDFDATYLCAIEVPYGRNQPGTSAKLNRVFGALVTYIPQHLPVWEVTPGEWRKEIGLPGNAPKEDCANAVKRLMGNTYLNASREWSQDALDAYAVAYYARQVNARGLEAA